MEPDESEEKLLHSTALQTANTVLLARKRTEHELREAKQELERKTEELAHSLAMMRATLESTRDGILVTDYDGEVTGFNQQVIEMWRIPPENLRHRFTSKAAKCHQPPACGSRRVSGTDRTDLRAAAARNS